uniref:LRRNT domain-containing protein n=1 Tax=Gasterosteus aculeatus TaxID=69293 RepID=G3P6N0_GASAC
MGFCGWAAGTLWKTLILVTLPHLTCHALCPASCLCGLDGGVQCHGNTIADVPELLPVNASQLLLDRTNITVINKQSLARLRELFDLDLSSNRLSSLASGLFEGLTNLTNLNLCKNSIKKFPPTIFHNLTNLRVLAICYNELEVLEAGIFDDLVNLVELKIHRNKITSLPLHVFWALRNLKTLTLSSNRLEAIPEKSFYNMPKLNKLNLFNNPLQLSCNQLFPNCWICEPPKLFANYRLSSIPATSHQRYVQLAPLFCRSLLCHNKQQAHPPSTAFNAVVWACPGGCKCQETKILCSGLSDFPTSVPGSTTELWLYDNRLRRVEDGAFRNLTQLRLLVLSRNQISSVSTGAFGGLEHLEEISLHTNLLTTLQAGLFQGLPSLVNISLEHNSISSLPSGFLRGLSSLGEIDLRNNSFPNLKQESLDALAIAKDVLLQQNPWRCDKDILPLRDWLKKHTSKTNQTLVVCETPFSLSVITVCTSHSAPFVMIKCTSQRSLYCCTSRTDVACADDEPIVPSCGKHSLTSDSKHLPLNLKHIEISSTPLTLIPVGVFRGLPNLEKIILKLNKLRRLENGLFDGLVTVTELQLHGNEIESIEAGTFDSLENLVMLHLAKNNLSTVSTDWFSKLHKLQTLRLYENQLTTIPDDIFVNLPNLKEIGLQDNPWHCDCNLIPLHLWMK